MSVLIGHASISEKGTTEGAKGDSTGKEVCTRTWYSKPWGYMAVHPDADVRERHARAVEQACANDNIGYGQPDRNTLNTRAKEVEYDLSKIKSKCNCDCSSLQNVAAVASGAQGVSYGSNGWTTSTMRAALENAGYKIITDKTYLSSSAYCVRGAIYVKPGSHTVCGLTNGSKASQTLSRAGAGFSGASGSGTYYPAFDSRSIVDGLESIGEDSSKEMRAAIAAANGINNYSGTYDQNVKLCDLARRGKLKRAGSSSSGTAGSTVDYSVGSVYTLQVDRLAVRSGAGTSYPRKSYSQLTANARENAYSDGYLKEGTRVTCKAVKKVGSDIWMQIPSGWVAAYYNGKAYIA
ncbi:MAG TPA: hypothetical protein H9750_06070 [Candidatus Mediterraneibacter excrementavium]|nr:hypothetical protein [Candidatus Mediterraneibacter excrementavium]